MRPGTLEPDAGGGTETAGRRYDAAWIDAAPTQPCFDLQLHQQRPAALPGRAVAAPGGAAVARHPVEQPSKQPLVANGQRNPQSGGLGGIFGRHRVEDENRRPDAGRAELDGLVEGGDREPVRTGRLEDLRNRHRAVAVRVGLDDRLDPNPLPDRLADRTEVGRQRLDVDLQPGGPRQWRQARGPETGLDRRPLRDGPGQFVLPSPSARTPNPSRLPALRRSAIAASRRRASGIGSGRSEARRPASPSRSRIMSPARPWR